MLTDVRVYDWWDLAAAWGSEDVKDDGVVDAFWFFFYSFNKSNSVFNVVFGNHVGDWEHTTVRFQHGVPKAIFFSEHSFGEAYTWEAVEKSGKRVSFPTHYRRNCS